MRTEVLHNLVMKRWYWREFIPTLNSKAPKVT